jgi:hypothetical protein
MKDYPTFFENYLMALFELYFSFSIGQALGVISEGGLVLIYFLT